MSFGTNKKAFYRYVRSKQQVKTKIQQLKKVGGGQTENDEQAANELSEFFRLLRKLQGMSLRLKRML